MRVPPAPRALLLAALLAAPLPAQDLVLRFVDVGQGDSILVKTPGGRAWLVDGGGRRKANTQAIQADMAALGIERLDGIVVSHPHLDHFGGLIRLVDAVEVGQVFYGIDIDATTYNRFKERLAARGIPYRRATPGPKPWDPALDVEILHARGQAELDVAIAVQAQDFGVTEAEIGEVLIHGCSEATPFGIDLNDFSVVLRVGLADRQVLLTGDATEHVEAWLLEHGKDVEAEILKVAHHGSRYSSTPEFLDEVAPDVAAIQSGAGNSYGHPHRPTLRKLLHREVDIQRNDERGGFTIRIQPSGAVVVE
jgi:competence protein ComEC